MTKLDIVKAVVAPGKAIPLSHLQRLLLQARQKLQAFFNKEYITFSGRLIMTSFGRVYNTRDDSGKKIK